MKIELSALGFHQILRTVHAGYFPIEEKEKIFKRKWMTKKQEALLDEANRKLAIDKRFADDGLRPMPGGEYVG